MATTFPIVKLNINNQSVEFRSEDVIEAAVIQEIHPLSVELPISTATVRIRTTDPRFSPFSDGEYYQALSSNVTVDIYESIDAVELFIGRFYVQDWYNPIEGEFEFICQDIIGSLDTIPYDGSFWENQTALSVILAAILDPLNVDWEVDSVLGEKMLKGYLPGGENVSVRETLQSLLFAARAYATTAKSEKLLIRETKLPIPLTSQPPQSLYDDGFKYDAGTKYTDVVARTVITDEDKVGDQKITVLPMVTGVRVLSHDYNKSTTQEDIYSATLDPGYYKVIFPKPYWEVTPTGAGDIPTALGLEDDSEGMTFLATEDSVDWTNCSLIAIAGEFEFGSNSIYLTVLETGVVSVVGKPWLDSVRSHEWNNPEAVKGFTSGARYDSDFRYDKDATYFRSWNVYANPNVWQVEGARMVTAETAPTVLEKLVEYANLRHQHTIRLFPRTDSQPGDLIIADTLYEKKLAAIVEKMRIDLTGGYLIETELVGVERIVN